MYCDECKDQAHAEKEELIRQRDEAYTKLDAALLQISELIDGIRAALVALNSGGAYAHQDEARDGAVKALFDGMRKAGVVIDETTPLKQACACKCHGYIDHNGAKIVCACCKVGQAQKQISDLGLDIATYEAARKEQAEGKRIPIEDAIKGLPEKRIEPSQKCPRCQTMYVTLSGMCDECYEKMVREGGS